MSRTVCIHQPDFLPWAGFFHRLIHCDRYVVLDNVQFLRRGWHHRDRIKSPEGPTWLTVPVLKRHRYTQTIAETEIDDSVNWRRKHLATLQRCYGRAPFFPDHFDAVREVYRQGHRRLIDLNMALIRLLMAAFGIRVEILFASALGAEGRKSALLADLVAAAGGDTYLSGTGARAYLEEAPFERKGIAVRWQRFEHPVHAQRFGPFLPMLSAVDLLFNCGPASFAHLSGGEPPHAPAPLGSPGGPAPSAAAGRGKPRGAAS